MIYDCHFNVMLNDGFHSLPSRPISRTQRESGKVPNAVIKWRERVPRPKSASAHEQQMRTYSVRTSLDAESSKIVQTLHGTA
jgi:hypothetical protein